MKVIRQTIVIFLYNCSLYNYSLQVLNLGHVQVKKIVEEFNKIDIPPAHKKAPMKLEPKR